MCEACIQQLSTHDEATAPPPEAVMATREISPWTFGALLLSAWAGCIAVIGGLVWLVLW
ncbi:MAG: hypothetical protein KF832_11670 [Caldilineaceae bacterium]|nr:hypothetical protein [Caldilineaceae bacterium]